MSDKAKLVPNWRRTTQHAPSMNWIKQPNYREKLGRIGTHYHGLKPFSKNLNLSRLPIPLRPRTDVRGSIK